MIVYSFNIDLDPVTLVLKFDLNMVRMYPHTENVVPNCTSLEVISYNLSRQTDRLTRPANAYDNKFLMILSLFNIMAKLYQ